MGVYDHIPGKDTVIDKILEHKEYNGYKGSDTPLCNRAREITEYCIEKYDLSIDSDQIEIIEVARAKPYASVCPYNAKVMGRIKDNVHYGEVEGVVMVLNGWAHAMVGNDEYDLCIRHEVAHCECLIAHGIGSETHSKFIEILDKINAPRDGGELRRMLTS